MVKIKNINKKYMIALTFVVLASTGVLLYLHYNKVDTTKTTKDGEYINLSPPSEEDKQAVADNKQKIVDTDNKLDANPPKQDGTKISVKPVITYASQYEQSVEVGAEVPVFEEGGTCTATFSLGNTSFSETVQAITNVNRVNCPVMTASSDKFIPKGTWSVVVVYTSVTSEGTSDTSKVTVQ